MTNQLKDNRVEPLLKTSAESPQGNQQTVWRSSLSLMSAFMRSSKLAIQVLFIGTLFITITEPALAQTWQMTSADLGHWSAVACSADGINLVAGSGLTGQSGPVVTSTNSGQTWITNNLGISANWQAVASSADGNTLLAAGGDLGGSIYYSTNAGSTWIQANASGAEWRCLACSADGYVMVAGAFGYGMQVSTNSGATWSSGPGGYWYDIACSTNGMVLAAVDEHNGDIVISTNFGTTWSVATNAPSLGWNTIACSADGTKLIAAGGNPYGDYIYRSTDSGITWSLATNTPPNVGWVCISSSADGTRLVAAGGNQTYQSWLFTSFDSGNTWISNSAPYANWTSVASSADGSVLVAVVNNGGIWTWRTAPIIIIQPTSQIVFAGSNTVFNAAVSAAQPLYYQWQWNGNTIIGATNTSLVLTNVEPNVDGVYSLIASNYAGTVTTSNATLTVKFIIVQPVSQIVVAGSSPVFSVAVAGSGPFEYLWYFANTNLIQSGTNCTLTLSNVSSNNAGNYFVVVTNAYGNETSHLANLTLAYPPIVTSQPASQTNLVGTSVTFSVMAGGTGPFTYLWQFNSNNLPNNIITTVAGKSGAGYSGDGGAATNASLYYPQGVAVDTSGNLYIADTYNNRIRKVDTNGIISTVAGKGSQSYSGDGGTATNASLDHPWFVAVDAIGELYIADLGNNRIRKVDTNGIITTMAGTSSAGYSGDGGAATNARLNAPACIAFDNSGSLYIADWNNNRIRKVDTNGIITTVAGTGNATFAGDGGAATNASLNNPQGVGFDSTGNLYIADNNNNRVRKVDYNGIITTVVGSGAVGYRNGGYSGDGGEATNAILNQPNNMSFDAACNMYIADIFNSRVRKVDTSGIITTVAGKGGNAYSGDGGPATNAYLFYPANIAIDTTGNGYIADLFNNRIRKVSFSGFPTLTLTNLSPTNVGNYTVVVTSPFGSVTSAVASLTVTIPSTPPQIITSDGSFGFTTNPSGFGFNLSGAAGQTIVVDGATNLVDWIPLFTNTAGGIPFYFFDSTSTNFPERFYRARLSQ